jgi:succinyl-CoA synthetase alpha subunit
MISYPAARENRRGRHFPRIDAVAQTGANTALAFVAPRFAADSILEADDAGIELIITITEGIPAP